MLQLFDRQAEQIIARLASEVGAGDRRWRRDLSHTLAGSAKAVGALRVGQAASAYEEALFSSASDRELKVLRERSVDRGSAAREAIGSASGGRLTGVPAPPRRRAAWPLAKRRRNG